MRLSRRSVLAGAAATALPLSAKAQLMPWGRRATLPAGGPPPCTYGTPTILPLLSGGINGAAYDLTSDGSVVVGYSDTTSDGNYHAVYWVNETGPTILASVNVSDQNAFALAITPSGSRVVGGSERLDNVNLPCYWDSDGGGGYLSPTTLPFLGTGTYAFSNGVVPDGTIIVGAATATPGGQLFAVYWHWNGSSFDVYPLPQLPAALNCTATDASADGTVIVGFGSDGFPGNGRAVYWTGTPTSTYTIHELPFTGGSGPGRLDRATAVSDDGTIIVGWLDGRSLTPAGPLQAAKWIGGVLTELDGETGSSALAISANGNTIGGQVSSPDDFNLEPSVWQGVANTLQELPRQADFVSLSEVLAVSDDEQTLVGDGDISTSTDVPLIWKCT